MKTNTMTQSRTFLSDEKLLIILLTKPQNLLDHAKFSARIFLSGLNLETSSMDFSKFSEGYNFVCCVLWQAGVYYVFPRTIPHKIDEMA